MRIRQMPVGFAVGLALIARSVLASTGTDGVQTILLADDLAVVANGEKIYQA
jgi:hypothetical protein